MGWSSREDENGRYSEGLAGAEEERKRSGRGAEVEALDHG